MAPPEVVRNLGDVSRQADGSDRKSTVELTPFRSLSLSLRTDFNVDDFSEIFFATHDNTDVTVVSLVNLVWIANRYLGNYERDQTVGKNLTRLF